MAFLNHNLPTFTCWIRNEYLFNHERGRGEFTLCDVHSVASIEKRVPLFEAFLNNGVNWTRRPLMAFCWDTSAPTPKIEDCYYWNCFSPYINVNTRARMAGLSATLIKHNRQRIRGDYMITMDWSWEDKSIVDTNFSETPEHKCAHMFKVEDGNFYAYPNNRIIWHDDAWIDQPLQNNPGYKIDLNVYSVENKRYMITDDQYMTEFVNVRNSDS
jgi:hypothetical protein